MLGQTINTLGPVDINVEELDSTVIVADHNAGFCTALV